MKIIINILICIYLSGMFITVQASEIPECQSDECVNYFKKYKQYSRAGHPAAMATLGELYFSGYGTDKNLKKALKYYKRAARHGSTFAQHKAGLLYLKETEVLDKEEGIKYLKKAARNKHGAAAFLLSVIYHENDYNLYDLSQSDKWLAVAYQAKYNKVPAFIDNLIKLNLFTANNFPESTLLINELLLSQNHLTPQDKNITNSGASEKYQQASIPWPKGDTEVITVTAPTISEIFDFELASFKNKAPIQSGTGSRLPGTSCADNPSCHGGDIDAYKLLFAKMRAG
ncbi:tetratricopeptide repeat protein [Pseudoalteromonas denitrificans]|uniref:Sel1 repeat-containing protein n=1 Tax=Pseudoalteromonas denitrificans DSM 6059 TaxID=1123010 RepID=A0A1I1SRL3_9GAMM|nr:tetratricopeptide repeat protein [Pseudoalteromonas denitrificans]SFD48981.1 Sel1 repeat-containing protein [Pseudoalteromonas denitrificans DSM 6059]